MIVYICTLILVCMFFKTIPDSLVCDFIVSHGVDHDLIDTDLLVDAGDHDFFVDGLIIPADKIMIEIHIFIIKIFYIRKRLEHKQIIHVKGMFRKLQVAFP